MEDNIEEQVFTDQQYYESIETSQQDEYHEQKSPLREQDRFLPIANVAKIMKKAVPANGKIAKESKECVQECVSEFISFITSEAAERCHNEKRKTVNGEDLLYAINSLGFDNYVEPLKKFLQKYRESSKLDSSILDDSNLVSLTNSQAAPMTAVILNLQGTPIALQTTTNANGQTVITGTATQPNGDLDSSAANVQAGQTILISNGGDDANGHPQQIFLTTTNGQTRLATAETLQQLAGGNNQQIILATSEPGKIDEDVKLPQNTIFLPVSLVNGNQVTTAVTQASNEN